MGNAMERVVDGIYRRTFNRQITQIMGRLGEVPVGRALSTAEAATGLLGRSALELTKASGRELVRAGGIKSLQALDTSWPDQRLEHRERAITAYRRLILSGEQGIAWGAGWFTPWAEAAWETDRMKHRAQAPKPPLSLAEDYFITLDQRGVHDGYVREEIIERILPQLPKDILDINDVELMRRADLHSMTPKGKPSPDAS